MHSKIMIFCKYIPIVSLIYFSPYSSAEKIDYTSSEQCIKVSTLCESLSVKGEFYKIIDAIYQQDFKSTMINELGKMNPNNPDLTKIDSYEFSITKDTDKNKYYVGVGAASKIGEPPIINGSIHYIIDATTLKILDKYQRH